MTQRHLFGVLVRGAAAVALCGGAVAGVAGAASASESTASSVSDCSDFIERWARLDDHSAPERGFRTACRVAARYGDLDECESLMWGTVAEYDLDVAPWVVEEACRRAD